MFFGLDGGFGGPSVGKIWTVGPPTISGFPNLGDIRGDGFPRNPKEFDVRWRALELGGPPLIHAAYT